MVQHKNRSSGGDEVSLHTVMPLESCRDSLASKVLHAGTSNIIDESVDGGDV